MSRTEPSEQAADLDADDPLASFRDRFVVDDDVVAYLDGNSLGRLPLATIERLQHAVRDEWGGRLIRGWDEGWTDLPQRVGDALGALVGAAPGQSVVADSTSVCLAKTLHAAASLQPGRDELVVSAADFPTDRYLVERVAHDRGLTVRFLEPELGDVVDAHQLADVVTDRTVAVLLSQVDYRSGALLDLPALTSAAHAFGALTIWDLCHSAGVVPVDLDDAGVDLAVSCTYKYLNGGPGAPAWIYAAARHLPDLEQPIPGWFGADDVFAMAQEYSPAPDARRLLSGTPSVLGLLAVERGVALTAEAGVEAIRVKSEALTAFAVDRLDDLGLEVLTPREPGQRGSHVTARHPAARSICDALVTRGVIPDFRHPDLVRLGLSPLTTTFAELEAGLDVLGQVVSDVVP